VYFSLSDKNIAYGEKAFLWEMQFPIGTGVIKMNYPKVTLCTMYNTKNCIAMD